MTNVPKPVYYVLALVIALLLLANWQLNSLSDKTSGATLRWSQTTPDGKLVEITIPKEPGDTPDELYLKLKAEWRTALRND